MLVSAKAQKDMEALAESTRKLHLAQEDLEKLFLSLA